MVDFKGCKVYEKLGLILEYSLFVCESEMRRCVKYLWIFIFVKEKKKYGELCCYEWDNEL